MSRSRFISSSEVIGGAWLLAVLGTLLTADEVKHWLAGFEAPWAGAAGGFVVAETARLGFDRVGDALLAVRSRLHGRGASAPDPAPAPAEDAPTDDGLVPAALEGTAHAASARIAPGRPAASRGASGPASTGAAPDSAITRERLSPRKLLLIGASSMQFGLGPELEAELSRRPGLEVRRFAKSATGLSQPVDFDWPRKLDELLAGFHADLVITNFGGNDATDITERGKRDIDYGTPGWDAAYRARVVELLAHARRGGAQIAMIGMPVMRNDKLDERIRKLNALTKAAVEGAGGLYIEQYDLSTTADGRFRQEVEVAGRPRLMREPDGIHYTSWGGRFMSVRLVARLEALVDLPPAPAAAR